MTSDSGISGEHLGRILLVEDNEMAARGLARLLQSQGYQVSLALTGAAALQALRDEIRPDIVLTDWQLPDMDGREVAEHVRHLDPPPRLLLVTGWDLDLVPEVASEWGVSGVLTKPIDFQELILALQGPAASAETT
jgi:CheY-like chemotaxis protein